MVFLYNFKRNRLIIRIETKGWLLPSREYSTKKSVKKPNFACFCLFKTKRWLMKETANSDKLDELDQRNRHCRASMKQRMVSVIRSSAKVWDFGMPTGNMFHFLKCRSQIKAKARKRVGWMVWTSIQSQFQRFVKLKLKKLNNDITPKNWAFSIFQY